jgi:hypothetical protein
MIQHKDRYLLVVEGDDIIKPLDIVTPTDLAGYLSKF